MQDGQKIKIYSIFRTVNGEICKAGQGSWATFIRFAGCNLKCKWCDTVHAQSTKKYKTVMSVGDIVQKVVDLRCRNVTITGGEPLYQPDGLIILITELLKRQFRISIETNGSFPILLKNPIRNYDGAGYVSWVVDYKLPSSGELGKMKGEDPWDQLSETDYIKFVIADRLDYDTAILKVLQFWSEGIKAQMLFSPVLSRSDPKKSSESVNTLKGWMTAQMLFSVRLNLQLHKLAEFNEEK